MERINKLLIILSVGIVLLISINACSSHFPGESDMVGQWVADNNAVLEFHKDSSFTLKDLDSKCWLLDDNIYYSDSRTFWIPSVSFIPRCTSLGNSNI